MAIKLFTNIMAYRLAESGKLMAALGLEHDKITENLSTRVATPPSATVLSSSGFITPCGEPGHFVERVGPDAFLLAVLTFERMLPAKVVRAEVDARARKIADEQNRKVYSREKQQLKDEVIAAFLPRTFIDTRVNHVLIQNGFIYVDTSSAKRSEDILCLLRETFGSLQCRPVAVKGTPIDTFTHWLTRSEDADTGAFGLTGDFKASGSTDESDLLTGKGVSLCDGVLSEALTEQLRRATQLGLSWTSDDGFDVVFSINEMLGMKGIKWDQSMRDSVEATVGESEDVKAQAIAEMRATMMLLSSTINELWSQLLEALGGEEVPQSVAEYLIEEDEDELV